MTLQPPLHDDFASPDEQVEHDRIESAFLAARSLAHHASILLANVRNEIPRCRPMVQEFYGPLEGLEGLAEEAAAAFGELCDVSERLERCAEKYFPDWVDK